MRASATSDLKGVLAGLLVLLLAMTGVGRGIAAEPGPLDPSFVIAGTAQPICHTGQDAHGPRDPTRPDHPDCCAACALFAAAVPPAAPDLVGPRAAVGPTTAITAAAPAPTPARTRSPRQPQAPPAS